jgi:hypothetical protein
VEQVFPAAFPWDGIRRMTPWFLAMFFWNFIVSMPSSPDGFNFFFYIFADLMFFSFFTGGIFLGYWSENYKIKDQLLSFGGMFDREVFEIKKINCTKILINTVQYPIFSRSWAVYYGAAKVNGKGVYIHSTRIRGEVIQIEYKGRFLIISPADPDGFLQAIEANQQSPTQPRVL